MREELMELRRTRYMSPLGKWKTRELTFSADRILYVSIL